ncbi:AbrB family transcriptional regulator [Alkalicoccus daliensis]|uniref:AbrB family transcriptional regulator n=1 Tax=Alkalicoccus daliensis TaxID=745820 RepID=A0A1H0AK65_9BACI|nr:AbrB family transcriptional regulator [Alkalicoccus daliensis]SDN33513.1 hypothetical protein SAMN04488053_101509 [Alkalicoccus daliensis]
MARANPLLTIITAAAGGLIFQLLSLPLAWMLGPLTAVMLVQQLGKVTLPWNPAFKQLGLIILGISFGLYFHMNTLQQISTYLIPYILITIVLVGSSVILALFIAKKTLLQPATTIFGAIPGGLTEMVIASEQLKAESSQVLIFQTVRLLIVLFTVPYVMTFLFRDSYTSTAVLMQSGDGISFFSLSSLLFILIGGLGFKFRNLLPAGIMIIPLLLTILVMVSPAALPAVPDILFYGAQLAVGVSLGRTIYFKDIKQAGLYSGLFAVLTVLLILISAALGTLLYVWTDMNLTTALLSAAPGGLIEMVLTASIVGADPAVVTSLQLIRIIIIIVFVPVFLKKVLFRD